MVTTLTQDPHLVRDEREKVLEVAIGREVRTFRRRQEVTVAELAGLTGLSITSALGEPFIIHYQDVDTGSNTNYSGVSTGSNTNYSSVATGSNTSYNTAA